MSYKSSSPQTTQAAYNQAFYRAIFDHAGDGMFVCSPNGQYLDANAHACAQLGYTRDELLRLAWPDLLAPEHREHDLPCLTELLAGTRALGELRLRLKDGSLVVAEISARPIAEGQIVCVVRDIGARQQAEQTLRESEQQLRQIIEYLPAGVVIATPNGKLIFRNQQLDMIFRHQPEPVGASERQWPLFDPESGEPFLMDALPLITSLRFGEAVVNHQIMILRGDRTWGCVSINTTPIFDANGAVALCVATFVDITKQRQAEEALLESEARFRSLADTAPVLIWMAGEDGEYTFVNQRWLIFTGHTLEHELGDGWTHGIHPDDYESCVATYRMAFAAHAPFIMDYRLRRADGRYRWMLNHGVPRVTAEGSFAGYVGSCVDVDESKRAQTALHELTEELEQRVAERTVELEALNQELEAFAYSVSHDLRAPLRAIAGYTKILEEDYGELLDAEGRQICDVVSQEVRHMSQLIDDLLALSRAGRAEMHFAPIDMGALVASIWQRLTNPADRQRLQFELGAMPPALADPRLIQQVWQNLIDNAVKFSSERATATISVGGRLADDHVLYYIHDTGAGFDMQYVNKLFGVFQRLHSEREFLGTGVGLAIVQRVITRHGGRVWAEGTVGAGATFYFSLPRRGE